MWWTTVATMPGTRVRPTVAGTSRVLVVSKRFAGLGTLRRHRLVYEAVGDLMTTDIHALSIHALAPGEPLPH